MNNLFVFEVFINREQKHDREEQTVYRGERSIPSCSNLLPSREVYHFMRRIKLNKEQEIVRR
jgi:hypothetical protein